MISLLDYGAGNVRSVINAIESLGGTIKPIARAEEILQAETLVFPGVGNFDSMMRILAQKQYIEPLTAYLKADRPFLGICLGLQSLFDRSEEAPGLEGLGIIPGTVKRFDIDLELLCGGVSFQQVNRIFKEADFLIGNFFIDHIMQFLYLAPVHFSGIAFAVRIDLQVIVMQQGKAAVPKRDHIDLNDSCAFLQAAFQGRKGARGVVL